MLQPRPKGYFWATAHTSERQHHHCSSWGTRCKTWGTLTAPRGSSVGMFLIQHRGRVLRSPPLSQRGPHHVKSSLPGGQASTPPLHSCCPDSSFPSSLSLLQPILICPTTNPPISTTSHTFHPGIFFLKGGPQKRPKQNSVCKLCGWWWGVDNFGSLSLRAERNVIHPCTRYNSA